MQNSERFRIFLLFAISSLISWSSLGSENVYIPRARPDPAGTPTQVKVGIYVLDIKNIDDVAQTYSADFFLVVEWIDRRLAAKATDPILVNKKYSKDEIWHPRLGILNELSLTTKSPDTIEVDSIGNARWIQRFFGNLSLPMNLRDYPFDHHEIAISVVSFGYGPEDVKFIVNNRLTGRAPSFTVTDWSVTDGTAEVLQEYFPPQDRNFARCDISFLAKRHIGYFLWKVIVPTLLIVAMSWTVFFIDPSELGPQLGISSTTILTIVAHHLSLSNILPRISYLTRADQFIVGSIILVFMALGEAIITSYLMRAGDCEHALRIDLLSRVGFPISYGLLIVFSFLF